MPVLEILILSEEKRLFTAYMVKYDGKSIFKQMGKRRKEAKSICIYSIISVFSKYVSQNSNAHFMAQQPPFRRGSLLLELLGGVLEKTLIRFFPISLSPFPQSCV